MTLRTTLAALETFCTAAGVQLNALVSARSALERLTLVGTAAAALVAPDERRKSFLAQAKLTQTFLSEPGTGPFRWWLAADWLLPRKVAQ